MLASDQMQESESCYHESNQSYVVLYEASWGRYSPRWRAEKLLKTALMTSRLRCEPAAVRAQTGITSVCFYKVHSKRSLLKKTVKHFVPITILTFGFIFARMPLMFKPDRTKYSRRRGRGGAASPLHLFTQRQRSRTHTRTRTHTCYCKHNLRSFSGSPNQTQTHRLTLLTCKHTHTHRHTGGVAVKSIKCQSGHFLTLS